MNATISGYLLASPDGTKAIGRLSMQDPLGWVPFGFGYVYDNAEATYQVARKLNLCPSPVVLTVILGSRTRGKAEIATCGTCLRSWDDAAPSPVTPVPAGRCPFEYLHSVNVH